MNAEESLKARIRQNEGFFAKITKDTQGFDTIGIGHKITSDAERVKYANGITRAEADDLFEADFAEAKRQISAAGGEIYRRLSLIRQGVLLEMVFQMGKTTVMKFRRMWKALEFGSFDRAADEMIDSLWYHQTPARCMRLAKVMKKDSEDAAN